MKVLIKCFLLIISVSLLMSCGGKKLSNNIAKEAIVQKEGYPKPVSYSFNKYYLKEFHSEGSGATANLDKGYDEVKREMTSFEQNGLVTIKEESQTQTTNAFLFGTTTRTWVYAVIELTDKGKQYLIGSTEKEYSVKVWEKDFDQITGIQVFKEQNSATVDYNEKNVNITPFGEVFSDKSNIANMTVNFSLYDDGWRIE